LEVISSNLSLILRYQYVHETYALLLTFLFLFIYLRTKGHSPNLYLGPFVTLPDPKSLAGPSVDDHEYMNWIKSTKNTHMKGTLSLNLFTQ